VQISLGYYPWQSQGAEAVGWGNRIEGPESNEWLVSGKYKLKTGDISVTETEIHRNGRKILVWNWYLVGNRDTPDPKIAKIYGALNIILYRRNDAAFLTLATPIYNDKLDSRRKLEAFFRKAHDDLHRILSNVILEIEI
ncbi:MAG: EpsI family protein, partial [Gammaproteobacteria bacterium]|nr:EpsI family protein [Gammaproteobacteria bacterium]